MNSRVLLASVLLLATGLASAQNKPASRLRGAFAPYAAHALNHDRGNAPPNDNCADAQTMTITQDCASPVTGNNADAAQDSGVAACDDPGTYLDVWYHFSSGAEDTVAITLTPGAGMTDWSYSLFDGCAGNELSCHVLPAMGVIEPIVPSTDYWIRVWSNTTFGTGGEFTLCINPAENIVLPPNDDCSGAVIQSLTIGTQAVFNGDNTGAQDFEGLGGATVWEAFTLNDAADVTIGFCGTTPAYGNFRISVFTECPAVNNRAAGSYENTSCGDGNWSICFPNLGPGTYWFPIGVYPSATGPYTLNVLAEPVGTHQASNDDCAGALPLTPDTWCHTQTFSGGCSSESLPAVTCGGFTGVANDDLWYTFTATAADMTIGGIPNGSMDIAMELFSGTCGSLTSIDCGDIAGSGAADTLANTSLVVGNTYYLRVYDYRFQYASDDPTYQLCLIEGSNFNLGVSNASFDAGGTLFPNPTTDDFNVRVDPSSSSATITVIDATGRTVLVRNERNTTSGLVLVHAEGKLAPGFYTVRVDDGFSQQDMRLIIE